MYGLSDKQQYILDQLSSEEYTYTRSLRVGHRTIGGQRIPSDTLSATIAGNCKSLMALCRKGVIKRHDDDVANDMPIAGSRWIISQMVLSLNN